ncbi:MAG: AraC family transcriptional regulator [Clostridia bacterium]|nr:AraC family transcriptional regulator [Clostridia bacterium]
MEPYGFYSFIDNQPTFHGGSVASDKYPLMVNCAGRFMADSPFVTDLARGREDYYFLYVERGELAVTLNGSIHTARSGSVLVFPPHYRYRYAFSGNNTISYLWVHFTGSYAERFLSECGFGELPCLLRLDSNIKIVSGFEKLFDIYRAHQPLQQQKLACGLEDILLCVATDLMPVGDARVLTKSLGYIHTFYSKDIRIPELAKMESLSNSRYITVFKQHMGMPPSEYIILLRLNVACDLLKSRDVSVKEVAARVGYDDPHFFSKIFKKKMGVSPQQYKDSSPL